MENVIMIYLYEIIKIFSPLIYFKYIEYLIPILKPNKTIIKKVLIYIITFLLQSPTIWLLLSLITQLNPLIFIIADFILLCIYIVIK